MEITNPFFRPLSSQRYREAANHIENLGFPFFIDLGCNDCGFLMYMSKEPKDLEYAIGVDKDPNILKKGNKYFQYAPQIYYKNMRDFKIYLMEDDISNLSESFMMQYRFCPFITMLEIIEHLTPSDVDKAVNCIFGNLLPQYVFLTTPNIEYNDILSVAFNDKNKNYKFRHPDHKFEFTREEFKSWVQFIGQNFNYDHFIGGIGTVQDGSDDGNHGFASHSVLFVRQENVQRYWLHPKDPLYEITVLVRQEVFYDEFRVGDEDYMQYSDTFSKSSSDYGESDTEKSDKNEEEDKYTENNINAESSTIESNIEDSKNEEE